MPWTYAGTPYPTPWPYVAGQAVPQPCIDTVRFLIGDTDSSDPQFQDGEISGLLVQNVGEPYQSAIEGCRALATKYARQADKTVGDLHILSSQKSKTYIALIPQLQAQAQRHTVPVPYAGGIKKSDKQKDQDNDDVVPPSFVKGIMDDTGTAFVFSDMTDGFNRITPGG